MQQSSKREFWRVDRRGPQDGTTHWSSRRLAAQLGTNQMTVSRVWTRHGLQPHRLRRYMLSEDPDFEKKAADILGLYLAAAINL